MPWIIYTKVTRQYDGEKDYRRAIAQLAMSRSPRAIASITRSTITHRAVLRSKPPVIVNASLFRNLNQRRGNHETLGSCRAICARSRVDRADRRRMEGALMRKSQICGAAIAYVAFSTLIFLGGCFISDTISWGILLYSFAYPLVVGAGLCAISWGFDKFDGGPL